MIEKVKELMRKMNDAGIPIPVLRDPSTGKGSVTLTLLFISSNVVLIALLNSFANVFKGVDTSSAISWFVICYGGYLGRRFQYGKANVEDKQEK